MSTPKLSQSAVICVNYFIHFIRWRREGQKDGNSSKYSYRNVQAKLSRAQIVVLLKRLLKSNIFGYYSELYQQQGKRKCN